MREVAYNGEEEEEPDTVIPFMLKNMINQPVCDELGLLQQGSKVRFGCDVLVFDVVFKLSLSLLQTPNMHTLNLATMKS